MKSALSPVLVILAGTALSSCANSYRTVAANNADAAICSNYVTSGPAVEEVRKLEEAGAASNVTGMTLEEAERMFAPDYVSVGVNGTVTSRDDALKNFSGGRSTPWATRFDLKELNVEVYCDMAIAIGLSEAEGKSPSGEIKTMHFRWLNVWTRSEDGWKLSATQFARF